METIAHTFIGGLDKDISFTNFNNNSYYHLENGRLTSTESNTMGAITDCKGNSDVSLSITGTSTLISGFKLVGYCTLNSDYILFYKSETTTSGRIYRLKQLNNSSFEFEYNGTNQYLIEDDFDFGDIVIAQARIENENIEKVYWTDLIKTVDDKGYPYYDYKNMFRMLNLKGDLTKSYKRTNMLQEMVYTEVSNLHSESNVNDEKWYKIISNGNLLTGAVQYTYRFVNTNGSTSNYAPLSAPIYLTVRSVNDDIDSLYTIQYIMGTNTPVNSKKSIQLKYRFSSANITKIQNLFDYMEVVGVYTYGDSTSFVKLVSRINVNDIETVNYITDTGDNYINESLSKTDITVFKNPIYCKTFCIKDNRLYLGNIKENVFWSEEIENWDSRAYRLGMDNDTGNLLLTLNNENSINNISTVVNVANFTEYIALLNSLNIPENYDCINPYNKYHKPTLTDIKYILRYDGGGVGGDGINVSYSFGFHDITITGDITAGNCYGSGMTTSNIPNIGQTKTYFESLELTGFTRDEVYRFGLVFYDDYGRSSFVKWIGDIKIDDTSTFGAKYVTEYNSTNSILAKIPYLMFQIRNIPNDVKNVQIVYVKREQSDKSVLSNSLLHGTNSSYYNTTIKCGIQNFNDNEFYPDEAFPRTIQFGYLTQCQLMTMTSVENLYTDYLNELNGNLYLELVGLFIGRIGKTAQDSLGINELPAVYINKFYLYQDIQHNSYGMSTPLYRVVSDKIYDNIKCAVDTKTYLTVSTATYMYINHATGIESQESIDARVGSSYLMLNYLHGYYGAFYNDASVSGNQVNLTSKSYNSYLGYYARGRLRKEVIPYGGETYNDRLLNNYIACSQLWPVTSNSCSVGYTYGDTWIHIFERCAQLTYNYKTVGAYLKAQWYYLPVETDINLLYVYSKHLSKLLPGIRTSQITDSVEYQTYGTTDYLVETEDNLYKYNTVYNTLNNINTYVPKPNDIDTTGKLHTTVRYSNVKFDGEFEDSWLVYPDNQTNHCEGLYGEITNLVYQNTNIYVFQEHAISIISANVKEIISGSSGEATSLGIGGALDKFNYISNGVGCQFGYDIVTSINIVYFVDGSTKKLYIINGANILSLSDSKKISSYLINTIDKYTSFSGHYDSFTKSVYFTFYNTYPNYLIPMIYNGINSEFNLEEYTLQLNNMSDKYNKNIRNIGTKLRLRWDMSEAQSTDWRDYLIINKANNTSITIILNPSSESQSNIHVNKVIDFSYYTEYKNQFTISYNELLQCFDSFHSFIPSLYLTNYKSFLTYNNDTHTLYQHNIGEIGTYYDSCYNLKLDIISLLPNIISEYNNIDIFSEYKNSFSINTDNTTMWENLGFIWDNSFDTIRCETIKEYSDIVELVYLPHVKYENDNEVIEWKEDIPIPPYLHNDESDNLYYYNIRKVKGQWNTGIPRATDNITQGDVNYIGSYQYTNTYTVRPYKKDEVVYHGFKRYVSKYEVNTYIVNNIYEKGTLVYYVTSTLPITKYIFKNISSNNDGNIFNTSNWLDITSSFTPPKGIDIDNDYWVFYPINNRMRDYYLRTTLEKYKPISTEHSKNIRFIIENIRVKVEPLQTNF